MKVVLALCLLLAVVSASRSHSHSHKYANNKFERRQGSQQVCQAGKAFTVSYNTYGLADDAFVNLDDVAGLTGILCNIDFTQTLASFGDASSAQAFYSLMLTFSDPSAPLSFVVEGSKFSCPNATTPIHRVLGAVMGDDANTVVVQSAPARYDEVFQDADMNVTSSGNCVSADQQICLGMNADSTCTKANAPISIYSNKYVTLACSDCFLGFTADVFLTLSIRLFHLENLSGGFRNMSVNGALVFDLNAQASWSTGVDKTVSVVQPTTVLSFKIGPVPIRIWFEIPVQITADTSFSATAAASVGVNAAWSLGDLYASWDPTHHWQTVTPKPSFGWTPAISGSAQFQGTANFAVVPTIKMHVDSVFTFQVTANPSITLDITGNTQSKQLCATATGDVGLSCQAELDINLPWVHVVTDKVFGPYTLYDTGSQQLYTKCVNV
eukprot:gnl/Hemi2/10054_TR3481_c0_g1_i1.p1 gnl/Hemi2/10054_TR3481_c0_g1~~gnl/Hemi2/10054_TR3481_c0_g1_i1.p1  ORF type:complete len:439 (-),score=206.28 gnl/Hemi2/10054_TR3481_c0_g1_i1:113-1429(-)